MSSICAHLMGQIKNAIQTECGARNNIVEEFEIRGKKKFQKQKPTNDTNRIIIRKKFN